MAVPAHGLPAYLAPGLRVAVVPPLARGERWHLVLAAQGDDAGQLVSLADVADRSAAEELVGRWLLAATADLPADLPLHDADALLGREVSDAEAGPLGRVEEVVRTPANDVWVIAGPRGEVMVPVVDEVVSRLPEEGPVLVRLPAGSLPDERGGAR